MWKFLKNSAQKFLKILCDKFLKLCVEISKKFFINFPLNYQPIKQSEIFYSSLFFISYLLSHYCMVIWHSKCCWRWRRRKCCRRQSKSICMKARAIAVHKDHCCWKVESTCRKNSIRCLVEKWLTSQQSSWVVSKTWKIIDDIFFHSLWASEWDDGKQKSLHSAFHLKINLISFLPISRSTIAFAIKIIIFIVSKKRKYIP